jgi:asparagine synthase (glutamine-hydrolysing)
MCGINGLVNFDRGEGAGALKSEIQAMNDAVIHRGPDGGDIYLSDRLALGHRRLSIIDLSHDGDQPMRSRDGALTLVFNGEIYNYLELMAELRAQGCEFRSRSDTEVILHAYATWGENCVQRFNGMWAFALWDDRNKRLFMSRDRFGVKPLFYQRSRERLIFSSEHAGILAVSPVHEAHLGKLHDYLAYGYRRNNGETLFAGIHEIPPAHNASVGLDGVITLRRYWSLPERSATPPPGDWEDQYRALLTDAVRLRFRSDVPVALLQSGGLDSSVICAVVNDEIEAGRLPMGEVTGYTAVYPGHPYDESAAVKALMATSPRIRSVEIEPDAGQLVHRLPAFIRAMQEPMATSTSYAHWCLMGAIHQQGIKVVINGQGADEALAGYGRLIAGYRLLDLLQSHPVQAARELRQINGRMGLGFGYVAAQTAKALLGRKRASAFRARFSEGGAKVLDRGFSESQQSYLPDVPPRWDGANLHHHLRSQLTDFGFNQILHQEDQSSMNHSIEIRSPFVDYRLMELAFSLPSDSLFSSGITKRLLRNCFAARLPASIVNNHNKIGFATPFEEWSRTREFQGFVSDIVNSESFKSRAIWSAKRLAENMQRVDAVRSGFPVWRFINAELWLREFNITNV